MKHTVVVINREKVPHKRITLANIGRRLARLRHCAFVDDPQLNDWSNQSGYYYLPSQTLSLDQVPDGVAEWTVHDLFGGVVTHRFMSTKLIAHPLFDPEAPAPRGWSPKFPQAVRDIVLPGFSVFSRRDLINAGEHLLIAGPVRIKAGHAEGGNEQYVLTTAKKLRAFGDTLSVETLTEGYVLEQNLADTRTYSVGQLCIGEDVMSYFGEQRTTTNNAGREAYGGTTFQAVSGSWQSLWKYLTNPAARQIVSAAQQYDRWAHETLDIKASRKNYDVITGFDNRGRFNIAVLEQSWRAGGATPAEILALEALIQDSSLHAVKAASHEVFGKADVDENDNFVCFCGDDPVEGLMTKYARLEAKYHAKQQS